jgi:MFS transporter, FLVCR family, feline leukemia virus subgroup C receptor-related protein
MFAPISESVQEIYNISELEVNVLSMVFMITYILFSIPSLRVADQFGLRGAILMGAFLTALGCWIRVVIDGYYGLLIGQIIVSMGQLPLLCAPPRVSLTWFGSEEWSLATSIGVMANSCGGAVAYLISPRAVPTPTKRLIVLYLLYDAIVCSLVCVLIYFFVPSLPPHPASQASALSGTWSATTGKKKKTNNNNDDDDNFTSFFKEVYKDTLRFLNSENKNINGYLLTFSYGIGVGVSYTVSTLLESFLKPMDVGGETVGWVGFFITVVGLAGSVIAGMMLDKYKRFKLTYSLLVFFAAMSLMLLSAAIMLKNIYLLFFSASCFGFFITAVFPVGFEYAVELSYPINEDLVATILNISSQIFGILFISCLSGIFTLKVMPTICLVLTLLVACGAAIFSKEETKRQNAQNASDLTQHQEFLVPTSSSPSSS